ncbi:MAG: FtsX-like permease family protein [Nitrospirota bacterium]|jgi:ABC-type lipoprotein release transport system permease subunit
MLERHLNFLKIASENIIRYKGRGIVVVLCLVAILFPFITAIAISQGVKSQSLLSVEEGADIYLTYDQYGKNSAVPLSFIKEVQGIEGILKVVPRVIGRSFIGNYLTVVAGMPTDALPPSLSLEKGRIFKEENEVIIGASLARALNLDIGHSFTLDINKSRILKVSGIFSSKSSIWSADLVFASFNDAAEIFRMPGQASDLLVYTRPGYNARIAEVLSALHEGDKTQPIIRVQTKDLVRQYFNKGFTMKEGIFTALYTVAFAIAIPALLVVSGFGMGERRREIGIIKAIGWQTSEIIEVVFIENLLLSLTAAPMALLISFIWIRLFNGFLIAQFFIAEIGILPAFPVPARYMPLPLFLSFAFALVLTMVGSMYSTWRSAVTAPAVTMK